MELSIIETIEAALAEARGLVFLDRPRALELGLRALEKCSLLDPNQPAHTRQKVEALSLLGFLNRFERKYDLAIQYYIEARELCMTIDAPVQLAEIIERLGVVYGLIGDQPKAIDFLLRALDLYRENNEVKKQGICLNNLGNFFMELNELPKALEYIQQGIALIPIINDDLHHAATRGTLSEIYLKLGEFDKAVEEGQKSIDLSLRIEMHEGAVYVSLTLGDAYRNKGDYHGAFQYLSQASTIAEMYHLDRLLAKALYGSAVVALDLKEYDDAVRYLLRGIDVAETLKEISLLSRCYHTLSQISEEQGDYKEAVDHFKKYLSLKECAFREDAEKRRKTFDSIHAVESTRKESEIRRIRDAQLQDEIRKRLEIEEKIDTLMKFDELTQVYNRNYFFEIARREVSLAFSHLRDLTVLIIDIDSFKSINVRYGHLSGDIVLSTVGRVLIKSLRSVDICGRYGPEKFIVLLPETSKDRAMFVVKRLRKVIESLVIESKNVTIGVTISVGIAAIDHGENQTLDEVVSLADASLREAKSKGDGNG